MNRTVARARVRFGFLLIIASSICCLGSTTWSRAEEIAPAQKYFEQGNAALAKGEFDAAIAAYDKVLSADARHAQALSNRGNALRGKGEYAKALDDYIAAMRLDGVSAAKVAAGIAANPARFPERPFLFAIEDVFYITGRGVVATGQVVRGEVKAGQDVEIVGFKETRKSTVAGIEAFRKIVETANTGDNVGILLRGVGKDEVKRGEVIATPNSMAPGTQFEAEVYLLTKAEGGRSTPIFKNYRPQFYFRTTDITGTVTDLGGGDLVNPGERKRVGVELIETAAIEPGLLFAIREGGRTVGMGVVSKVQ